MSINNKIFNNNNNYCLQIKYTDLKLVVLAKLYHEKKKQAHV